MFAMTFGAGLALELRWTWGIPANVCAVYERSLRRPFHYKARLFVKDCPQEQPALIEAMVKSALIRADRLFDELGSVWANHSTAMLAEAPTEVVRAYGHNGTEVIAWDELYSTEGAGS